MGWNSFLVFVESGMFFLCECELEFFCVGGMWNFCLRVEFVFGVCVGWKFYFMGVVNYFVGVTGARFFFVQVGVYFLFGVDGNGIF